MKCRGREDKCPQDVLEGYDFCSPCLEAGCGRPGHYGYPSNEGEPWCSTCERMTMASMPVYRPSAHTDEWDR